MRKLAALVLGALAAALGAVTLWAGPAGAHAFLTGSTPADGSVMTRAPRTMVLDFSESIVVEATRIDIVDSSGRHIHPSGIHLVGQPSADTEVPTRLAMRLPTLPHSAYTVSWQTVSSDDLHATSGVFAFGVAHAVHAVAFAEPAPRLDEAGLRWIVFAGLALATGAALWLRLTRRSGAEADPREVTRARRLGLVGALGAAVVSALLLVDQVAAGGGGWRAVLDSGYALRWTVREAGLVLLAVALSALSARAGSAAGAARAALLVGGTGAAAVGSALLGHSSSGPTRTLADSLHVAATAVWAGTLLHAGVVLLVHRRRGVRPVARVLRGFRIPALASVATIIVTGLYLAGGTVGSVDAALRTDYGRVLLLKLVAVAAALLFGLVNTTRLHGRRRTPLRRRTVLAEAGAVLVVLGLAAVLTAGQPATERRFVTADGPPVVAIQSTGVADLSESLSVRPNRPGENAAIITVSQTRRPAPAPITGVVVRTPSGSVPARALPDGSWSAPVQLDNPGVTAVAVTVLRAGQSPVRRPYRWVVAGTAVQTAPAVVSTAPLRAGLTAASFVLGLLVLVAGGLCGGLALARRRRPPSAPAVPGLGAALDIDREPERTKDDLAQVAGG